ncbi:uncharacterized protein KY384_002893 [Bacidia gigantensis]|uniref:uncharacterized protein n=1 Tax=Bacidia gigantensis TaxID=2732470 RepID=UPI001D058FAD|nr:uncharacterized protein KY384_002893 [Bacidia gigantensis]KAG8532408.1 hypothetical protein KY384_002893 [Bacidia gigantensis]
MVLGFDPSSVSDHDGYTQHIDVESPSSDFTPGRGFPFSRLNRASGDGMLNELFSYDMQKSPSDDKTTLDEGEATATQKDTSQVNRIQVSNGETVLGPQNPPLDLSMRLQALA